MWVPMDDWKLKALLYSTMKSRPWTLLMVLASILRFCTIALRSSSCCADAFESSSATMLMLLSCDTDPCNAEQPQLTAT